MTRRDYYRELRKRRNKDGLCARCGQHRKRPQKTICDHCVENSRERRIALKKKLMDGYGGKCKCCEDTFIGRLTIDHMKNDGNIERATKGFDNRKFYKSLIDQGFPKNFQILCASCNLSKYLMGYCPH